MNDKEAIAPYAAISSPTTGDKRPRLAGSYDVFKACADIARADREHFVAFFLDVRHRVIGKRRTVAIGTLSGVDFHPRELFKDAILASAAAIIVVHNHPSGDSSPSAQDVSMTTRIKDVGELVGIPLLDHVVVAGGGYVSFAERNWR